MQYFIYAYLMLTNGSLALLNNTTVDSGGGGGSSRDTTMLTVETTWDIQQNNNALQKDTKESSSSSLLDPAETLNLFDDCPILYNSNPSSSSLRFPSRPSASSSSSSSEPLPTPESLLPPSPQFSISSTAKIMKNKTGQIWSTIPRLPSLKSYRFAMPDPWSLEDIKPKIIFYRNGLPGYEIDYLDNCEVEAKRLLMLGYLNTSRLIIITHGFHNNINTDWLEHYRYAIFNISQQSSTFSSSSNVDQTVAILGWGGGADLLVFRYRQAASNVMTVGWWLGNHTKAIHSVAPQLPIYGIGHSLGAHVMGLAGRGSKAFTRITGLDPAGPCFENVVNSQTLNYTDAKFVDVIHTDGYDSKLDPSEWVFPVNHYGSLLPIGTVDFYPNYGYHQPGAGTFTVAGSHLRSLELFYWSIMNRNKLVCDKVLAATPQFDDPVEKWRPSSTRFEMGYWADQWKLPPPNSSTLFYIATNDKVPWV